MEFSLDKSFGYRADSPMVEIEYPVEIIFPLNLDARNDFPLLYKP